MTKSSTPIPRVMRSAGFCFPAIWFQGDPWVSCWISETLLATKVFHVVGGDRNQASVTEESDQKYVADIFIFNASTIRQYNLDARTAADNSSLGMESCFNGATLDLAAINWTYTCPLESVDLAYPHAPYARSDASAKKCNCTVELGTSSSHPHGSNQSSCRKIFAFIVTGAVKPSGSNCLAIHERMDRFVGGNLSSLWSNGKENSSVCGSQLTPRARIAELGPNLRTGLIPIGCGSSPSSTFG
ncbi:uncharacterized protein LOC129775162 [Toxorhynchites rutilus septentrionalis]|uniref:uncharacterized protein LOC129775162 n=1 Tax=Toxorhynchites rutilus septentrionalis TaxID=329112 RepID=UPI002479B10E|nr:uncharacterized protein LOC129775162 [Toxorhynchites rutilus septentrionalis]